MTIKDDPTDAIPLAISMLEECDRWAADALSKYIHKIGMFETALSVHDVYIHQQKIRIVLAQLKGTSLEEEGVVTKEGKSLA